MLLLGHQYLLVILLYSTNACHQRHVDCCMYLCIFPAICTKSQLLFKHCICIYDFMYTWFYFHFFNYVTMVLLCCIGCTDVHLTCIVNVTYLLAWWFWWKASSAVFSCISYLTRNSAITEKPHDAFRGQSRSPSMVPFDILGIFFY